MTPRRSVNRFNSEVALKKQQDFLQRLFSVTIDRDQIVKWENDLDRVLALFRVCLWNFIWTAAAQSCLKTETLVSIAIGVNKLTSELKGNANGINVPK